MKYRAIETKGIIKAGGEKCEMIRLVVKYFVLPVGGYYGNILAEDPIKQQTGRE